MFRGHETQVAHQLACRCKAIDVADLRNESDRADGVDAAQGTQRRHDRFEAPALDGFTQCIGQPLHALVGGLHSELVLAQSNALANVLEALSGNPDRVALRP
ncbi:hypothetical protein X551_02553 [Methylibium sp. T29]|nr:hypothetical protein X551_02553 [Methylibium sp. T29]EWS58928.1 hypothetical protein Y694_03205 [Methylibium sp. T29-B]